MKVSIQGGRASFHHAAAVRFFPDQPLELIECNLFSQVCEALAERKADYGVMAIENTVAGAILPNYLLLMSHVLHVVGEVHLRIDQNLMALPGQQLSDIRVVRSHPMALHQCSQFFHEHPSITPQEAFDTAESAREIRQNGLKSVAAIAGRMAAELYALEILAAEIENERTNFTRFLLLSREPLPENVRPDKATITFSIAHKAGALLEILTVFQQLGLNLTLIQSVPLAGKPCEYMFCIDFEFGDQSAYQEAIVEIRAKSLHLAVLGVYRRGMNIQR